MSSTQAIIHVMRAGAREFLERPASTNALLEAFVRLTASQRKAKSESQRGRVFAFINAKGGSGATTLAVNTALALQAAHGSVALIDLAPIGHIHLHLSIQPQFCITDAIQNLHRMDESLLVGYMARHKNGLDLLAGSADPSTTAYANGADFARLFDLLVGRYRHVIVDLSSRLDAATRTMCDLAETVLLIAQADVTSLWSATRVREFLGTTANPERIRLVLNRYRKMPGFGESQAESSTRLKLFRTVPSHFPLVSSAIDRGIPVVQQNHSDLAQHFTGFASALVSSEESGKRRAWPLSTFRSV
jgi:pilus assembly protein CpaE